MTIDEFIVKYAMEQNCTLLESLTYVVSRFDLDESTLKDKLSSNTLARLEDEGIMMGYLVDSGNSFNSLESFIKK